MKLPLCAVTLALCACTADEAEVAPPRHGFYYPTGMATSGTDEAFLFVSSANADLRFAAGTVQTIDLDAVEAVADAWEASGARGACTPSASSPRTLLCPTEVDGDRASFMLERGAAQIGNFAVDLGVQKLASGVLRIFTTVRGDPSITWMDFDPAARTLDCGEESSFPRCAEVNRLDVIRKDETLGTLVSEPFYLYVDGTAEHVFVSHLTSGAVSLVVAPLDGSEPYISDIQISIFAPTGQGLLGATGIAALSPGTPTGLIYVSSPREARVAIVRVVAQGLDANGLRNELLVRVPDYILIDNLATGDRNDARSLALSMDGTRLYVVNRMTPQILIYDVTPGPTGAPKNQLVSRVEICAQAASLAVADMDGAGPETERIYVPCFSNGQVWVVDPARGRLAAIIESGRGPNAVVAAPIKQRVYVTNYAEDTISVIDAHPGSSTENYVTVKIGVPRGTTLPVGAASRRSLP